MDEMVKMGIVGFEDTNADMAKLGVLTLRSLADSLEETVAVVEQAQALAAIPGMDDVPEELRGEVMEGIAALSEMFGLDPAQCSVSVIAVPAREPEPIALPALSDAQDA